MLDIAARVCLRLSFEHTLPRHTFWRCSQALSRCEKPSILHAWQLVSHAHLYILRIRRYTCNLCSLIERRVTIRSVSRTLDPRCTRASNGAIVLVGRRTREGVCSGVNHGMHAREEHVSNLLIHERMLLAPNGKASLDVASDDCMVHLVSDSVPPDVVYRH